jgi:hypothetical protein
MDSSDRLSGVLFTLGLCILSRLWVNDREHIGAGCILRVNGMSASRGYLSYRWVEETQQICSRSIRKVYLGEGRFRSIT